MFKDALIIFKKEVRNLTKDRRTLFSTFILPMIILPVIFIGIGTVAQSIENNAKEASYKIEIVGNNDSSFKNILTEHIYWEEASTEAADFRIIFGNNYVVGTQTTVILSFDSSSRKNQIAAAMIEQALFKYELSLADKFLSYYGLSYEELHTIRIIIDDTAQQAAQSGGAILAMLMPYFLVIFLFSGSMNAGLDTTSGEKERGSLAVLLVNQVSRSSIAWGKILYVSVVSLISAIATFLGLLLAMSLPGSSAAFGSQSLSFSFETTTLLIIIVSLFSSALVSAGLITLIGCFAKSVKEGGSYVMPLYMIVVIVGVTTMYMDPSKNSFLFLIPIVNTIFVLKESFMGIHNLLHIFIMLFSNLALAYLEAKGVSKLFNSEKILQTV